MAAMLTVAGQCQAQMVSTGNEMDLLKNDGVRASLGLTPAQEEKLAEIAKSSNTSVEVFNTFRDRMKNASSEEQPKIREEMQQAIAKSKEDAGLKALAVLDSRQLKVLRASYLTRAGSRALADPRIATEFTLTDDQKTKIGELAKQQSEAARAVPSDASEEAKLAFKKDWDGKALAVLTADQKKMWDGQIAEVPSVALAPVAGAAAPAPAGETPAMAPDAAPPAGAEIVSSFGSASDVSDGTKLVEKFSFNFRYAPWDQVLQDFATGAGYTLDLGQVPPGTFSHLDNKEYTASQAMDVMNGYLQRKGYALVVKDGFLVCVNVDSKGFTPNLIPDVAVDDLLKVENGVHTIGNNEIVRIEIPLERLDVGVMAQEVEALLGPLGNMTAFTQTGSLIIADTGSNLRRIKAYVDASIARRKGDLVFKSYPLKNIDAEEAEFMLLSQFGMRQGVANVSQSGGGDRRGGPSPVPTAPTQLQVLADARSNSLFVTGTPDQQVLVDEILKAIEGAVDGDGKPLTRTNNSGPYLKVYKVAGQADQVALSINSMMPGVIVNESGRDGTVHVYGTEKQQVQVEEWIKEFAQATGAGGSVAVIPLAKMDPLTAAATLRNLFISEGAAAPTVETDLYGNRIIVKGTAVQVDQIKQVLKDLGEDGTGVKKRGEGGTVRRYSLRGRDPQEFFNYLQQEWEANEKTPIRVVVPRKSGPIKDLKTPSGILEPQPITPTEPTTKVERTRSGMKIESGYFPVSKPVRQETVSDEPKSELDRPNPAPQATAGADGIQIVVDGDELLLLSQDEGALDRLEETMDFLQQSIPFRTKWTVFYLQAADATEAAALLEQFIPSSSVSNTASTSSFGLSSMFSPITQSVSDMTGLSGIGTNPQILRIIPDTRSNSLFVTGPQSLVEECQSFLRYSIQITFRSHCVTCSRAGLK